MNQETVRKNGKTLLRSMSSVENCQQQLAKLDKQLTRTTLTGKINCTRIAQNLIDFIITTQSNFTSLQENLVETLVFENTQKVVLELSALAQVAVDILKRNLFERTADVGFLATDDDIVRFLKEGGDAPGAVAAIEERLLEYRNKYTVYYEIIVLDTDGGVRAHLDRTNQVASSRDPLLGETLETNGYVETFRQSDLVPGRGEALIYSQAVRDPASGASLGVLCLCFDFAGEMTGIFESLRNSSGDAVTMILDDSGKAIASSDPQTAPVGKTYATAPDEDFRVVRIGTRSCLAKTQSTKGYQDYLGLPWCGHVVKPVEMAFQNGVDGRLDEAAIRRNAVFSSKLIQVEETSENILSDLELVVQNGEIMAAKKTSRDDDAEKVEALALPHVLNEVKKIGSQIQRIFQTSTGDLLRLVTSSRLHDVQFLARLAIDIMDRNLYERANDCRWWALTSDFRRIMEKSVISEEDRETMRSILGYINSLYTVYTNLFLYDAEGRIQACSNQVEQHHEGRILNTEYVSKTLQITDSQLYCVSPFDPTDLYADGDAPRNTYVYNASITSLSDSEKVLGGIGIVFDSEPQFKSMLIDALPKDERGRVLEDSEAMFTTLEGEVVSSTNPNIAPGEMVEIPADFAGLTAGESASRLQSENGGLFAMGCAHSAGYREYKRDGAYVNDLLGILKVRI